MPLNTFAYWSKSSLLLGALLLGVLPQAVFAQNQSSSPNVQIVNPTPPTQLFNLYPRRGQALDG